MKGSRIEKNEKPIVFSYPEIKTKNFSCVQCKHQFSSKENNFYKKESRVPLLLPCGHTVCDYCHQTNSNLTCNACEQPQLKTENSEKPNLFIDVYTLGAINLSQNRSGNINDPDLHFYQSTGSKIRQTLAQDLCSECMHRAVLKCVECNVLLCDSCFAKLHGRALENHCKVTISNKQDTFDISSYTKCAQHDQKPFFTYCQECCVVSCSVCLLELHNGHTFESIAARNESLKEDFDQAYKKIAETLQRVHHTQKKTQRYINFPDQLQNSELEEANVNQYFSQIHGVLQLIERELLEKVKSQRTALRNHMENIKTQLYDYEKLLENGLMMAASVRNSLSDIDLSSLIKKMNNIANLPCHLYKETVTTDQRVRFEADKTILDVLKNHCSIHVPDIVPFTLLKSENLPPNYTLEPINLQDIPSLWTEVKTRPPSPTPSVAMSTCSTMNNPDDTLVKGGRVMVHVTHIADPFCFYVRQVCLNDKLKALDEKLSAAAMKNDQWPTDILLGSLYIVKYLDRWYRGRVQSIKKNQQDQETYEIFFIDYGNTSTVLIHEIRYISQHFSTPPAFAIKCSLHDIEPKDEKWQSSATKTVMMDLIKNNIKPVIMYIYDISENTYFVDLCSNNIDRQISLRDNLLVLGFGTFISSRTLRKTNPSAVRKFFLQDLKISKFTSVRCSHVESPDSIYIVKINGNAESFERLKDEMKREYKKGKPKSQVIYEPDVGMICAAQNIDSYWYRAVICDIPCIQTAEVFFVDIGKKEILNFSKLRKMQQKFMILTTQAVRVSLRDVVPSPVGSSKWDSSSIEFLKETLLHGRLKVFPHNEIGSNHFYKSYSVSLYTDETNINTLLVSSNHAISTGVSSEITTETVKDKQCLPTNKKIFKSLNSFHGGSTLSISPKNKKAVDELEDYRLRVVVLNAKSPDCIYVADPTKEAAHNALQIKMQKFYNRHVAAISEIEWQKDQMCAVYSRIDKAFFRGKILNVLSETELSVLLIDLGLEETFPLDDVQPLDKDFLSTPRYQFKINLADIIAPGGTASWPSSSCQKLREIINENDNFKFYITKVSETVDETIPAELWVKVSILDGPFASDKIEYRSVSRLLAEAGFAIPLKGFSRDVTRALALEVKKQLDKGEYNGGLNLSEIMWSKKNSEDGTLVNSDTSTECTDNDDQSDSDNFSESASQHMNSKWIPADPIETNSFRATATYVDHKCFVYLHAVNQNEVLKYIETNLDEKYSRKAIKPCGQKWKIGDICIAQYHNNKKWYRAQIKRIIDHENVQVEFVDYGNTEDCEIGTIKKRVILQNIPIQCTKCVIQGLRTNTLDGTWSTSDLDKIHCHLVDKEFDVNVIKRTGNFSQILHVSITLLQPKYCDFVTYASKETTMNILDPRECYSDPESSDDSIEETTMKRVDITDNNTHIEKYISDCQANPNMGVDYETEFPALNSSTKVEEEKHEEPISKAVDKASSIESVSWNNLERNANRMITSTPQLKLDTSEPNTNSTSTTTTVSSSVEDPCEGIDIPDLLNRFKNDDLVEIEMSNIAKKGLKQQELEFIGHVTGGNKSIKKVVKRYSEMDSDIQIIAPRQPLIKDPKINMLCYALYTDGKWYRGVIKKYERNSEKLLITVRYIDYGNNRVADISEIREMDAEFRSVPSMAVNCKAYGIVPKYGFSKTEFSKIVIRYYEDKTLFAKIKECNLDSRTITVDLYLDSGCTQPAVSSLIEQGLFQPKN
ncbi:RING finger protein 17 [Leptopilina heterotoma]|uniref:RING finger protein 17 n=1 Tax=Leptopilina heterotoma TaxID=63436 RepID=UPI001CA82079|nr:RING finger protein 17 [Leptopilina heterotoma]XP_043464873.1 RING finger protein 17 [Leptopilina heterotoma]